MRHLLRIFLAAMCLAAAAAAWPVGGGGGPMPTPQASEPDTPEQRARRAYDSGVRSIRKADKLAANPAKAERAAKEYRRARDKFEDAVTHSPSMHQAWNYLGYARRKLGDYDSALAAYDRALALRPKYPEAIEYRAEAYLGLHRIEDAKSAYLDLFAADRKLADQLLSAMQRWVADRKSGAAADPAVDELEKWVQERAQIASQTAALTREGTGTSWR